MSFCFTLYRRQLVGQVSACVVYGTALVDLHNMQSTFTFNFYIDFRTYKT